MDGKKILEEIEEIMTPVMDLPPQNKLYIDAGVKAQKRLLRGVALSIHDFLQNHDIKTMSTESYLEKQHRFYRDLLNRIPALSKRANKKYFHGVAVMPEGYDQAKDYLLGLLNNVTFNNDALSKEFNTQMLLPRFDMKALLKIYDKHDRLKQRAAINLMLNAILVEAPANQR